MNTIEIIESGFVKAFISEYFEYKTYSINPDKDRLLYILCSNENEKQQVTNKQIEIIKNEIQKLGYEELSYSYLLSCKPESRDYIEYNQRFEFWLIRFCEVFIESIETFTPFISAIELHKDDPTNENLEYEINKLYPDIQKLNEDNLPYIIERENELLNDIEFTICEYKENDYWEFDFEEYHKFIDINKPIEILINLSELLVQLERLETFKSFLIEDNQSETKNEVSNSCIDIIDNNDKYIPIYDKLINKHIETDYKIFVQVLNYKRILNDTDKIKWVSDKVLAIKFKGCIDFSMKQFNDCFFHKDGKKFHDKFDGKGSRTPDFEQLCKEFSDILKAL